ncbi:MAG: CHRD domain-containing protein [Chitinophagaceae bacterium]|nr:CHRD domain-containing protein [Rubrivivax sp.]
MHTKPFLNWRAVAIASLVAGLAACGGSDDPAVTAVPPETLQVILTGDQEAPKVINTAANAKATLSIDRTTRTISGTITINGFAPTLAHIHAGEAGVAGPVVFPLTISGNTATLAATVVSVEQLATLDAGGFYFNVHSAANPGGEIRGQIGREVFVAHMTGSQETTAVESAATGDGRLVVNPTTGAVSGEIVLAGIKATAAHVHTAAFGTDGAILVPLEDHGGDGHFVVPAGTVLKTDDLAKLRDGGMYFNAHSAAHPGGEIRGQIGRRVLLASASGAQEVPSNGSKASGRGFVVYDSAQRTIEGKFKLTDIAATIAHIHQAPAGSNGPIIIPLSQAAPGSTDWVVASTEPALSFDKAQALLTEGLYYNAHSAAFPGGEIRGQIRAAADDASPVLHIVSPASGVSVARGEGVVGAGSFNGTGFSINLEMITRDSVGIAAEEGLNVRNTSLLGSPNPKMPTLVVTFDADLIKPDGTIIPKNTNLASLFNIAGSDDTPGQGITLWSGWHVLESFAESTSSVTITASVTDKSGRVATDRRTYSLLPGRTSGQSLTPSLAVVGLPGDGVDDAAGPEVTMIAPRPTSSVSTGPQLPTLPRPPLNSSVIFIQVSALDKAAAGISTNENGEGKPEVERGTIEDRGQIAAVGPNRDLPGLFFSFDVPLQTPQGPIVPAGQNLAPLFNIVGSEMDSGKVRTTYGWVVGGSLVVPAGKTTVTAVSRVTDNAGNSGSATSTFGVSPVVNGQELTPSP